MLTVPLYSWRCGSEKALEPIQGDVNRHGCLLLVVGAAERE